MQLLSCLLERCPLIATAARCALCAVRRERERQRGESQQHSLSARHAFPPHKGERGRTAPAAATTARPAPALDPLPRLSRFVTSPGRQLYSNESMMAGRELYRGPSGGQQRHTDDYTNFAGIMARKGKQETLVALDQLAYTQERRGGGGGNSCQITQMWRARALKRRIIKSGIKLSASSSASFLPPESFPASSYPLSVSLFASGFMCLGKKFTRASSPS
jgi:hypothetical protein